MAKNTHKDVEFFTTIFGKDHVYNKFSEAVAYAVTASTSTGHPIFVDVIVYSRAGARWWAGDYGVEEYENDPDGTIHERIEIRAESQGRIS